MAGPLGRDTSVAFEHDRVLTRTSHEIDLSTRANDQEWDRDATRVDSLRDASGCGEFGIDVGSASRNPSTRLVLPLGDEEDVTSIARALLPRIEHAPRPRVLVGASLGAMVAIEVARLIDVDALVLIAAGFGVHVSESALEWVDVQSPGADGQDGSIGNWGSEQRGTRLHQTAGLRVARRPARCSCITCASSRPTVPNPWTVRRPASCCGDRSTGACPWRTTSSWR